MPPDSEKTAKLGRLTREADVIADAINVDARTVELNFSSETPVLRRSFFSDNEFNEILDHAPESVRLARFENGASVLLHHDSREYVGVVENASIDSDRRGRAVVRFGKGARAVEAFNDIKDGILRKVSIGYRIHEADLIEADDDGPDELRAVDWEPFEISMVAIAADDSVGVGRAAAERQADDTVTKIHIRGLTTMPKEHETDPKPAPKPEKVVELASSAADKVRATERQRIADIQATANQWRHVDDVGLEAERAISEGHDLDKFRANIMPILSSLKADELAPRMPEDNPRTNLGLSRKETESYSVVRAVRALLAMRGMDPQNDPRKLAGFEIECSNAVADELGIEPRGILIPYDVQQRTGWGVTPEVARRAQELGLMQRTVPMGVATTGTVAAALKGTELMANAFIEALAAESVALRAGAVPLPGLVGDVDIPKQTGLATFTWVAEDADGTDTEIAIGSVSLAPKTVSGPVPITRKLMKQSTPAVEQIVRNDLIMGAARAIDVGILRGSGSSGQPEGIVNATGVNTATVAASPVVTHAEAVAFETAVGTDNALSDSAVFMATWAIQGAMKITSKDTGSGQFVWQNGEVNGYRALATSQLAADQIIFGSFNQAILGMWGVLDINVDTATKAKSGGLVLRAFQDVDVGIRHAEAFCIPA